MLCRAPKSRIADDLACSHRIESVNERLQVPDYALDQHTQKGKKNWVDPGTTWSEEGCRLQNEVDGLNVYRDRTLALRKKHGRLKPKPERERRGEKKCDRELFDGHT